MPKKIRIITHNGNFHPDELFAVATFLLYLDLSNDKYEIIRTRDPEMFKTADYLLDLGSIYDSEINRFDHHQTGGAGKRSNGIPYATFGLVWKKFGKLICQSEEVANRLDEKLVQSIDADDNGVALFTPTHAGVRPYQFEMAISSFSQLGKKKTQTSIKLFLEV